MGFPDGAVVEEPTCQWRYKETRSDPWVRKDPTELVMATYFQYSCQGNLVDRDPGGHGPWDRKRWTSLSNWAQDIEGYPLDERVNILVSLLLCHVGNTPVEWPGTELHTQCQIHPAGGSGPGRPKATAPLATFLLIYLVTLVGNLGLIDVIRASTTLHTPMYFLLSLLSFLDVCGSSLFTPRLLISFLTADQSISFEGCVVQMALMTLHGSGECVLLSHHGL